MIGWAGRCRYAFAGGGIKSKRPSKHPNGIASSHCYHKGRIWLVVVTVVCYEYTEASKLLGEWECVGGRLEGPIYKVKESKVS